MTAQKTNIANFFQTNLTANVGATDVSFAVGSTSGLTVPFYIVMDPLDASRREVTLVDSSITSTTMVTASTANRFLTGSAAASGLTHDSGAKVWCVPLKQHVVDLNDRIDTLLAIASAAAGDIWYAASVASGVVTPGRVAKGALGQMLVQNDGLTAPTYVNSPPLSSRKTAVRCATTANGTDATAFANGQTIDGITLVTGDRVLRKNQTTGSENGIVVVQASGAPVRATDFDAAAKSLAASDIEVSEGTVNAGTRWVLSNTGTVTPGSTAMVFKQKSDLFGVAQGDIIYFDGTNWKILPKSTDGKVLTLASSIPSWAAAAAAKVVTASKVATSEATASTSYTALATAQAISITPTGTQVRVKIGAKMSIDNGWDGYLSFAESGGRTTAASDANSVKIVGVTTNSAATYSDSFVVTGLTAGVSYTYTLQAKAGNASHAVTAQDRNFSVEDA